jgi:hypothetical protein
MHTFGHTFANDIGIVKKRLSRFKPFQMPSVGLLVDQKTWGRRHILPPFHKITVA